MPLPPKQNTKTHSVLTQWVFVGCEYVYIKTSLHGYTLQFNVCARHSTRAKLTALYLTIHKENKKSSITYPQGSLTATNQQMNQNREPQKRILLYVLLTPGTPLVPD